MNTTVWLITFTCSDGKPVQVVHTHNCIADYRQLDPNATAQAIDCAAVAELIEAAKEMMQQDAVQRATFNTNPFMADAADKLSSALGKVGAR